jgi:hypothetical protein
MHRSVIEPRSRMGVFSLPRLVPQGASQARHAPRVPGSPLLRFSVRQRQRPDSFSLVHAR